MNKEFLGPTPIQLNNLFNYLSKCGYMLEVYPNDALNQDCGWMARVSGELPIVGFSGDTAKEAFNKLCAHFSYAY